MLKKGKPKKQLNWDCENAPIGAGDQAALIAGQHTVVGYATVTLDESGENYIVTYNITDSGYCLTSTHVSVVSGNPSNFPNNNGNPPPGQFEFKTPDPDSMGCSGATYTIPVSKGNYFAIHGVVNCVGDEGDEVLGTNLDNLPATANACVDSKAWIECLL